MKKCLFYLCFALVQTQVFAQLYVNKSDATVIQFFSKTPMEDISASNKNATSVFDAKTDSIVVKVPMNKFIFPNGLMQEHYNENYLETEKYPYAYLKGKFTTKIPFTTPGTYTSSITGNFTCHNVTQPRTFPCTVVVDAAGVVTVTGKFDVKLADHKIDIPTIVTKKIAEVIQVDVKASYVKKQ